MIRKITRLFIILTIFVSLGLAQKKYKPTWESLDSRATPAWFEDAKFGIFIHWGLYSVPSWGPTKGVGVYEKYAEWYWRSLTDTQRESHPVFKAFHDRTYGESFKYQDFVTYFTCEMFEPEEWARIFGESGAKYIVLTSKHHEGFALWPSIYSWNWNAGDAGPHRDLAGDLIKAVRAAGLRMGFYYSLYEWYNPLYHKDVNAYVDSHMLPQMKELVTNYKPDLFWPDGEWDYPSETWHSQEFLAWLYNESPVKEYVAVNDRWGKETRSKHGGYYTTEYDLIHEADANEVQIEHPWEECRGIGTSFGFNRNEYLENYSTSEELVHILINKVARGGNLLLNIGPTADGRIPVIMQQRLKDMGNWLNVNGEAIYGTRKWEKAPAVSPESIIYYTVKDNDLYVICTTFPTQAVYVDGINQPDNISLLGYKGKIESSFEKGKLTINPPAITPADNPCDYAWTFKLSGALR
jgi:alpha-L-fucosidase